MDLPGAWVDLPGLAFAGFQENRDGDSDPFQAGLASQPSVTQLFLRWKICDFPLQSARLRGIKMWEMMQIHRECIPGTAQASCSLQGVWRSLPSSVLVPEHHTKIEVETNPVLRVVLGTFETELKMAWDLPSAEL